MAGNCNWLAVRYPTAWLCASSEESVGNFRRSALGGQPAQPNTMPGSEGLAFQFSSVASLAFENSLAFAISKTAAVELVWWTGRRVGAVYGSVAIPRRPGCPVLR